MKLVYQFLAFLVFASLCLTACGGEAAPTAPQTETTEVAAETAPVQDHAAQLKLDMSTDTAKVEATVKTFVDGDTVHFYVPTDVSADGVLKARFLAINTPESTGKVEEYGKKASNFTKEVLSKATSILLESETDSWDPDSTGSRYLTWVWYKTDDMTDYRNLNVEILQNGLALANSTANNRYGETCMAALNQAKVQKLNLYSGQPDPDFFYGDAVELTLKELRTHIDDYNGTKVAFTGIVTANSGSQGVYLESYDRETDRCYGMYVYYGHGLTGAGLDALSVGNEARVVGTVQYYEAGGTWQVSGVSYRQMKPDDPDNLQKLSTGNTPSYTLTTPAELLSKSVELPDGTTNTLNAELALATSVELRGLYVSDAKTMDDALVLKCQADDATIAVRTVPLRDESGIVSAEEAYMGKTIDVKGIVDFYDGAYQIRVFTAENITIN